MAGDQTGDIAGDDASEAVGSTCVFTQSIAVLWGCSSDARDEERDVVVGE